VAQWIRCFAHVLNLITKAILRPFGPEKIKKVGTNKPDDEFDNISDNKTDDGDEDAGKQILL
jgi:hypothetical protein